MSSVRRVCADAITALATITHRQKDRRIRYSVVSTRPLNLRWIHLRKTVAGVGHGECAVLLRRHLDPVRRPVVGGRRRVRPWQRQRLRGDRHGGGLIVDAVGDEYAWHRVLLPAEQREVNLPEILEPRRAEERLHHDGPAALSRAV